jgi:ketopantoate reductase
MKFLCIGAGAIGICIGGSLASAGQQVYFWVKPKHQEKLSGRELTIYNG